MQMNQYESDLPSKLREIRQIYRIDKKAQRESIISTQKYKTYVKETRVDGLDGPELESA